MIGSYNCQNLGKWLGANALEKLVDPSGFSWIIGANAWGINVINLTSKHPSNQPLSQGDD